MENNYYFMPIEEESPHKKRKRFFDSDYEQIYREMYKILRDANRRSDELIASGKEKEDCRTPKEKRELGGYVLHDEMLPLINERLNYQYNKGNISATLQYGRRQYKNKKIKMTQWIMASPEGLFLPKNADDERICAYAVSNFKEINSRATTQNPLFFDLLHLNPEGLQAALNKANVPFEGLTAKEMNPWAVWSKVMDSDYIAYGQTEESYYDDNWWEEQ